MGDPYQIRADHGQGLLEVEVSGAQEAQQPEIVAVGGQAIGLERLFELS